MSNIHSFHIPVMGTAFTIDSPIRVAKYGIDSVISLVDDTLIEQMRKYYCEQTGTPYTEITKYDEDHRARRITEYLNLIDVIVKKEFEDIRQAAFEKGSEITKYFEMLEDSSPLKTLYNLMNNTEDPNKRKSLQEQLRDRMEPGEIQVNIMTKLDRTNYGKDKQPLPPEFSDALAALRGFAQSTLRSAIIFSAGFNRRLYSYVEQFKDFFADANGDIKKKIIIKVSDYRSSITQGKFFAKKGIWISEYRIESGLNCGGHAFASDGYLMGPILEEFRTKREELAQSLHDVFAQAAEKATQIKFDNPLPFRVTAQGGIGTNEENNFIRNHYNIDGTGWGTPMLLVPEATNVDDPTMKKLVAAKEEDLYLSDVSPIGVPFNNIRGSLSDTERDVKVDKNRPGSACPKGHLKISNTEFTEQPICVASRQYQKLKIDSLKNALDKSDLTEAEYKEQFAKVVEKACICHDLGESALDKHGIQRRTPGYPAICPGPNLAYFDQIVSLQTMTDHIYGRTNIISHEDRPHLFIKELGMYVDYFIKEVAKWIENPTDKQAKYLELFKNNMLDGIDYYKKLYKDFKNYSEEWRLSTLATIDHYQEKMLASFANIHQDQ